MGDRYAPVGLMTVVNISLSGSTDFQSSIEKVIVDFNSVEEVVTFAIDKESEAAQFYRAAADQEKIQTNKNVLEDYAREEEKHERMLREFADNGEAVAHYRFRRINDLKRSDYMVEMNFVPGMTYFQVMRIAMKREEKAYKLYQDLSENAENEKLKHIFKVLAQEELKHKNGLETIYDDHLARTGD